MKDTGTCSISVLVLTGFGINCEEEMAQAFEMAGAKPCIAHLNELFNGQLILQDFDILALPGGFSFGDDLGSGKVMANKIKFKSLANGKTLLAEIQEFLAQGKLIVGICNGFQMLVRMGLLPNVQGRFEQEVSLYRNDSGKFEDRWVYTQVTHLETETRILPLPVRHGEGKLIALNEEITQAIENKGLMFMRYCDEAGNLAQGNYPTNPNGSLLDCAGLCDPSGQVWGMMPHPEAYLSMYNRPDWAYLKRQGLLSEEEGQGLAFFKMWVAKVQSLKQKTQA